MTKLEKVKEQLNCELKQDFKIIKDSEHIIYKRINDRYEIEISGLHNHKRSFDGTVYLWADNEVLKPFDFKDYKELKKVIKSILKAII